MNKENLKFFQYHYKETIGKPYNNEKKEKQYERKNNEKLNIEVNFYLKFHYNSFFLHTHLILLTPYLWVRELPPD